MGQLATIKLLNEFPAQEKSELDSRCVVRAVYLFSEGVPSLNTDTVYLELQCIWSWNEYCVLTASL